MKVYIYLFFILVLALNCKKNKSEYNACKQIQWVQVYSDSSVFYSTGHQNNLWSSGKIITDNDDNIYLFYCQNSTNNTLFPIFMKFSKEGKLLSRKIFNHISVFDLIKQNDGTIILVGSDNSASVATLKIFAFRKNNTVDSVSVKSLPTSVMYFNNASVVSMPDNSIMLSAAAFGSYPSSWFTGSCDNNFFAKISPSFQVEWRKNFNKILPKYPNGFGQNSIAAIKNNQCVFQYAIGREFFGADSFSHGLLTGVINTDGTLDTFYFKQTGYTLQTSGVRKGINNRFVNGIMPDESGGFIYHFSNPIIFDKSFTPNIPSGFLRINSQGQVTDTIGIPLPEGYDIAASCYSKNRFLISAHNLNDANTLFYIGGNDLKITNTFSLQNYYNASFSSIATMSDGSFIIMGRIQSFNGSTSKLVLMKWK